MSCETRNGPATGIKIYEAATGVHVTSDDWHTAAKEADKIGTPQDPETGMTDYVLAGWNKPVYGNAAEVAVREMLHDTGMTDYQIDRDSAITEYLTAIKREEVPITHRNLETLRQLRGVILNKRPTVQLDPRNQHALYEAVEMYRQTNDMPTLDEEQAEEILIRLSDGESVSRNEAILAATELTDRVMHMNQALSGDAAGAFDENEIENIHMEMDSYSSCVEKLAASLPDDVLIAVGQQQWDRSPETTLRIVREKGRSLALYAHGENPFPTPSDAVAPIVTPYEPDTVENHRNRTAKWVDEQMEPFTG